MDEVTITVPKTVYEPIRVTWGGAPVIEPLGVTELQGLLAMALRARLTEKRTHPGEGGNFYEATHHSTAS